MRTFTSFKVWNQSPEEGAGPTLSPACCTCPSQYEQLQHGRFDPCQGKPVLPYRGATLLEPWNPPSIEQHVVTVENGQVLG